MYYEGTIPYTMHIRSIINRDMSPAQFIECKFYKIPDSLQAPTVDNVADHIWQADQLLVRREMLQ